MNVVVDARPLDIPFLRAQGIGRYTHGLLSQLPAVAAERGGSVVALRAKGADVGCIGSDIPTRSSPRHPDALGADPFGAAIPVRTRVVRRPPVPARAADLPEQVLLPIDLRRAGADVAHSLSIYRTPLRPGVPLVVTVHDVVPLLWPERYLRTGLVHRLLYAAARRARRIICPSRAAARDVIDRLGFPAERVSVVPEGVDPRFRPGESGDAGFASGEGADMSGGRGAGGIAIERPYALFVGGLADDDPRKDVAGLNDAFAAWAREGGRPERLVLAGRLGPAAAHLRDRAARSGAPIVFTDFVDERDLPGLYRGATCLVSATRYEGFGLPMLEAIACGTPVAAYDVAALPEVCGPGAKLVVPGDAVALMRAVERLCDDTEHRRALAAAGAEHARGFSWRRTAEETWVVYESAR
jgi:glycosyltransferase involved in cell wall biosynthesis